jgi:hypothetical protein
MQPSHVLLKIHAMTYDHYDEGDHNMEVYAYFGLAFYMANVFETNVAQAVLCLDFLTQTMETIKSQGGKGFDRARYTADFDAFMSRQHAQTLGKLIKRAQELVDMGASLKALIAEAKVQRDFLAHHFWRERAEWFASRRGRDNLIAELKKATGQFDAVDHALTKFMQPHYDQIGLTQEVFAANTAKYLQSLASDD